MTSEGHVYVQGEPPIFSVVLYQLQHHLWRSSTSSTAKFPVLPEREGCVGSCKQMLQPSIYERRY